MAYRFFILLFLCLFTFSAPALAQGTNNYKNATDEQIKEAQTFQRYCEKDEVMSKQRDCRCAAAAYLDARMKLGDDAAKKDVARSIRSACYSSTPLNRAPEESASTSDDTYFNDVTDKQIEEAQSVYQKCSDTIDMRTYTDCECLAAAFLDMRLQVGEFASRENIMLRLDGQCRNVVDTVGQQYSTCIDNPANDFYGYDRKTYCECYARRWGELFKNAQDVTRMHSRISLNSSAEMHCKANAGIEAQRRKEAEERESMQPQ